MMIIKRDWVYTSLKDRPFDRFYCIIGRSRVCTTNLAVHADKWQSARAKAPQLSCLGSLQVTGYSSYGETCCCSLRFLLLYSTIHFMNGWILWRYHSSFGRLYYILTTTYIYEYILHTQLTRMPLCFVLLMRNQIALSLLMSKLKVNSTYCHSSRNSQLFLLTL